MVLAHLKGYCNSASGDPTLNLVSPQPDGGRKIFDYDSGVTTFDMFNHVDNPEALPNSADDPSTIFASIFTYTNLSDLSSLIAAFRTDGTTAIDDIDLSTLTKPMPTLCWDGTYRPSGDTGHTIGALAPDDVVAVVPKVVDSGVTKTLERAW